jgi:hypothetical protein
MGCCGQKRDNLRANTFPNTSASGKTLRSAPQPSQVQPPQPPHQRPPHREPFRSPVSTGAAATEASLSVALQYTESSRVVVEGPVSGRRYEFSADFATQMVDARDAGALLNTRFFRRT